MRPRFRCDLAAQPNSLSDTMLAAKRKSMRSSVKPTAPEQRSHIRLTKHFGVVTPDRFKILTDICGKSRGIRK